MAEAVRVPEGTTLQGDVDVEGDLRVAGRIVGSLRVSGALFVETGGSVEAGARVGTAVIGGAVRGDVIASHSIHLLAGCHVEGDLRAPKLTTEEGAVVRGRVELGDVPAEAGAAGTIRRGPGDGMEGGPARAVGGEAGMRQAQPVRGDRPPPVPASALVLGDRRKRIVSPSGD